MNTMPPKVNGTPPGPAQAPVKIRAEVVIRLHASVNGEPIGGDLPSPQLNALVQENQLVGNIVSAAVDEWMHKVLVNLQRQSKKIVVAGIDKAAERKLRQ